MGIEQVKGIGPATTKKLDQAGVRTLSDMRTMDTTLVAKRTGIQKRSLDQWRMEARMMKVLDDVKGIGPATKKRLQQAGIHSLEDLARESAHQVAHQARVAKERAGKWQKEAQRLLKQTQERLGKEQDQLKKQGKRAAKVAKETTRRASRAAKRGSEVAGAATRRTREAALKGREAADGLMNRVRERRAAAGPVSADPAPGEGGPAEETSAEHGSGLPDRGAPGKNGDGGGQGGFVARVKRLFQPRG